MQLISEDGGTLRANPRVSIIQRAQSKLSHVVILGGKYQETAQIYPKKLRKHKQTTEMMNLTLGNT